MKNLSKDTKRKSIFNILIRTVGGLLLVITIIIIIAGITPPGSPSTPSGLKQFQSVYVTVKDGTKIAVRMYLPATLETGEQIPSIIETTRYVTVFKTTFLMNLLLKLSGETQPNLYNIPSFLAKGYAYIRIEARGSGASFGTRDMEWSHEETTDIGHVIDWIVEQPWSNGKVATYGVSYSGNTAEWAVSLGHPNLIAAIPMYSDFDEMLQNVMPGGILNTFLLDGYTKMVNAYDTNTGKNFFFNGVAPVDEDRTGQLLQQAVTQHNTLNLASLLNTVTYIDDALTKRYTATSLSPFTVKDDIQMTNVPFYVKVGWLDAGTVNGALERFLTYDNSQTIVIGPWNHAGWQMFDPFLDTKYSRIQLEQETVKELDVFLAPLLSDGQHSSSKKEITYYTMGEGVWKTTPIWPVEGFTPTPFYFHPDGTLQRIPPEGTTGTNIYTVDFSATTGGHNRWRTNLGGGDIIYPDRDQEDRKLLTYTSEPLEHDIEITGVPTVTLHATSTEEDGAFYVYLEVVAPDGKVMYITEGQLRALHRHETERDLGRVVIGPKHSYEKVDGRSMIPGENTTLRIGMFATSVLVKQGYRLRIAIAGHDASNFARIPAEGTPTIEVQTNGRFQSFVELPTKRR